MDPAEPPQTTDPTPPTSDAEHIRRARAAALRFLSYRHRSEAELRRRLLPSFPAPVVEKVVEALKDSSILDDAEFARQWSDSRKAFRPRSAWVVKRELIAKGVDRDLAEKAVSDIDEDDGAYRAGVSRARKMADAEFDTFRRRLWCYLKRRGFSDSVSRHAISRIWEERQTEAD